MAQRKVEMNIDRFYRNQDKGVAGNASTKKTLFTEDGVAGLPFHFDLRAICLIWCEVLKGWSASWGGSVSQ